MTNLVCVQTPKGPRGRRCAWSLAKAGRRLPYDGEEGIGNGNERGGRSFVRAGGPRCSAGTRTPGTRRRAAVFSSRSFSRPAPPRRICGDIGSVESHAPGVLGCRQPQVAAVRHCRRLLAPRLFPLLGPDNAARLCSMRACRQTTATAQNTYMGRKFPFARCSSHSKDCPTAHVAGKVRLWDGAQEGGLKTRCAQEIRQFKAEWCQVGSQRTRKLSRLQGGGTGAQRLHPSKVTGRTPGASRACRTACGWARPARPPPRR